MWDDIETNIEKLRNLEKFKIPLVTIIDQLSSCQPSWMASITKNHKNDPYYSQTAHRELQQKINTTKSIFNFNILSAILDGSHYQHSQKWLPSLTEST